MRRYGRCGGGGVFIGEREWGLASPVGSLSAISVKTTGRCSNFEQRQRSHRERTRGVDAAS